MILILSQELDASTNDVIDWLLYYNADFLRINDTDVIRIESVSIQQESNNIRFCVNNDSTFHSTQDFTAYWYRRGYVNLQVEEWEGGLFKYKDKVNQYLKREKQHLLRFFIHQLEKIPYRIGSILDLSSNKLINLTIASQCGLKIPNTSIHTLSDGLREFQNNEGCSVSKAISDNLLIKTDEDFIMGYTSDFSSVDLDRLPESIFPSLIQKKIDKLADLRVFYLQGEVWGMAIFSQSNDNTSTDFRNDAGGKVNRVERYCIDSEDLRKIHKFMKTTGFDNGSLDFAIDENGQIIFLEINAVGQFGMVSIPCNYNLEKIIAEKLIHRV